MSSLKNPSPFVPSGAPPSAAAGGLGEGGSRGYTVQHGDTLTNIADRLGAPISVIMEVSPSPLLLWRQLHLVRLQKCCWWRESFNGGERRTSPDEDAIVSG